MKCIYQHAQHKRNVYIIESIKFVSIVYVYVQTFHGPVYQFTISSVPFV